MGLWWQLCGNPFSLPSVFLSRAAGLTVRGREEKKKREADAAPQNTLQPDEVILPGCTRSTYAHITESGRATAITALRL